ncbi:CACHD1 [Branchiostoma lanceolatum]|uniref:chitinase n=1 Tax=Branchiostoma lanceolatum TaxID=7740 RepID=A0A8K0ESL9_BRALA|nr:CACHD1 [Branchiostoma lanceolatum]
MHSSPKLISDHKVGVVSFSEYAYTPEGCLEDSLGEANPGNIKIMQDFINSLTPIYTTYYARGFEKAFSIFETAKLKKPEQFYDCHNVIIFLTDGEPKDGKLVLDQITEGQNRMGGSVHIFTYGLGDALQTALSGWCDDPSDPCSRSKKGWFSSLDAATVGISALDFLATIADQNNRIISNAKEWTNEACGQDRYGSCFDPNRDPQGVGPPGRTESVGDGEGDTLMKMMGSYYDFFQSEPEPTFSVPTKDDHLGLTITAAIRTVDTTNTFFGVTAVDISMDIVFNEIVNFNLGSYSHACLVDREDARVLLHRDLPKPMEWPSDPTFLQLDAMKGALTDDEVTKILNGESGNCYHDNVKVPITRGNAQFDGVISVDKAATFYYEPIPDTKYSVVLCLFDEDSTVTVPSSVNPEIGADSLFHRLDLLNTTTGVCRLYDNYATLDGSTIMFPPGAYSDPIGYLGSLETSDDVVNIEQFLNDATGSVSNPGLVDGVRTDVVLTAAIEQYWRENDAESVWRYVGTRNGLFRIFPGITVDRRYDPTQKAWYMRALSRPEDYTFSRPVPSPFGGGNMVTISRVIAHTSNQEILGVIAADITERQYHSLLYSEVPECLSSAEFECFLLDDSGYFMQLATSPNMEHDHLTNRFPWLAKELVAGGEFLMSGWCNNYVTHNSQLYYDTSGFTGMDVTSGPPCNQFSMYPINNTNTFLLVLHNRQNNNCDDSQIQDCSCDEVCQTCDTNAQSTCQCPCSCDWDYASCTNGILGVLTDVPCPPPRGVQSNQGMGQIDGQPPYQPDPSVQDCEEMCSAQSDSITCEALPHCAWCQQLAFPVCKKTCFPTTPEPTTTLQPTTDATTTTETTLEPTTDATTTTETTFQSTTDAATTTEKPKTTIAGVTTPNFPLPGSQVDCMAMPAGMYPDPQDCTMFYQCAGFPQPLHMPCAPGTLFDWNLSQLLRIKPLSQQLLRILQLLQQLLRVLYLLQQLLRILQLLQQLQRILHLLQQLLRIPQLLQQLQRILHLLQQLQRILHLLQQLLRIPQLLQQLQRILHILQQLLRILQLLQQLQRILHHLQQLQRILHLLQQLLRILHLLQQLQRILQLLQQLMRILQLLQQLLRILHLLQQLLNILHLLQQLLRILQLLQQLQRILQLLQQLMRILQLLQQLQRILQLLQQLQRILQLLQQLQRILHLLQQLQRILQLLQQLQRFLHLLQQLLRILHLLQQLLRIMYLLQQLQRILQLLQQLLRILYLLQKLQRILQVFNQQLQIPQPKKQEPDQGQIQL